MKALLPLKKKIYRLEYYSRSITLALTYFGGLVYKEQKSAVKLGLLGRLKAYRKGFSSQYSILYRNNPKKYDIDLYISDVQRYNKIPRLNERYGILLADKNLFSDIMYRCNEYMPAVYGKIYNGKIFPDAQSGAIISSLENVKEYLLTEKKALVFKPFSGYGGNGIFIAVFKDNKLLINNKEASWNELENKISQIHKYIINEYVMQSDYSARIFNGSANTMRILTIYDKDKNKASIIGAAHRFGVVNSIPVDNFTQGGLCTDIDLNTGVMGMSATKSVNGKVNWLQAHPDTKEQIQGIQIKNWELIREKIIMLAEYLHYCPVIGWDILSVEDGFKIIEANDSPSVALLQLHKPLLLNDTLYGFYRKNKILKKRQIKAVKKNLKVKIAE